MNKKISFAISIAFHPIVINTIALFLLFNIFPSLAALNYKAKSTIMAVIVSLTTIIPIVMVGFLKITNQIDSIELNDRKERNWPYAVTALGYLVSFYLLQKVGISVLVLKYLLASGGTVICISVINYFWKISAHMASIGALLALLVVINFYLQTDLRLYIVLVTLIAGITGSARLFANAHSALQLVAGFVLGFVWIYFLY